MTNYEFAVNTFNSIRGIKGKDFGLPKNGVSDGNKGVQWNISVNDQNGEAKLGVNLEGLKYKNWPISTFLEEELHNPRLPSLAKVITDANKIYIELRRDAWRGRTRPPIEENIQGRRTLLSELTNTVWRKMLNEANQCLDTKKHRIGRATQEVTLASNGEKKKMQVSPHLIIYTTAWSSVPLSEEDAQSKLQEAFSRLSPFYDFVKERSGDFQTIEELQKNFDRQVMQSLADSDESRKLRLKDAPTVPRESEVTVKIYSRNPDVVVEVLLRAKGYCEKCGNPAPFNRVKD